MNQIVTRPETSINAIGIATGVGGSSIAPQNLGEVVRFAEVMCKADIALPKHLRGNAGACMAVALQALEWQMSPFAVASKSYAVNGMIAYEAQLIAAVVNTRSGIKGRLKYEFVGEGNELSCKVTGTLDGEECSYETPPFAAILPKNSPLWKTDPRQQLGYYAARSWARRHCPEVLLGVYDREEAEHFGPDNAKDVSPRPSLAERLTQGRQDQPQDVSQRREGFAADLLTSEADTAADEPEIDFDEPSDAAPHSADDAGSGETDPSPSSAAEPSEPGGPDEAGDIGERVEPGSSPASDNARVQLRRECLDKFLEVATRDDLPDPKDRRGVLEVAKNSWKESAPNDLDFVKACFETADKVIKAELKPDVARRYLEGLL
jgi:hypothetical protein